ncbi:hypothetical protein PGTUg99_013215 [Puccinia graminis f. sp. tritici]|uniref:Uncharacterized protein n=2 Tax=Puccinia graminis f. sp. tritici TaxID=56615 RepID=E3KJG1_PUCGT|nr:uncharacterized protein PGTG_10156 [Puccinia graminis f. sp. tritici CRL 75-36-700-3]EFP84436.1 hypothetical protein PGTG_10156 [Puccinia graminis f. sp. tritici CRL 75-36-700-3]KAA1107749.1 hypothetical protein PGTUg99_013215 [Puccinia graminis f. sp. tritici]
MILKFDPFSTLAVLAIILTVHAHNEPETEDELRHYLDSQRSIYHCYPEILKQVEHRKSAFLKASSAAQLVHQTTHNPASSRLETLEFGASASEIPSDYNLLHHQAPSNLICTQNPSHFSAKINKIRNSTCVLSPIVRAGPYYHLEGHPIRQDLAEWQEGLPLSLDIGVIDVETCRPVEGALVDIWHANATGFYAGHPSPAEGDENEKPQVGGARAGLLPAYPRKLFDEQWLRGAWPTDKKGVARFNTIFPGYYTGRATHIHTEIHMDWEVTSNGTFTSKDVQYIGQFFFDDEINMSVDKMWPYTENPVKHRTRNWRDSLKVFQESRTNGFQPTLDVIKIGSVINQGLVGFMTIGIKTSHHFDHHYNPTKSDWDF